MGVISGFPASAAEQRPDTVLAALVDRLKDIGSEGIGFSTSVTGSEFLPLPGTSESGMILLGQRAPEASPTLKAIVERGVTIVPVLLEHIDDARPTRLPPVKGMMWMSFADEYDFNRRLGSAPAGINRERPGEQPSAHQITVGDLCFVALGQIVNRGFNAARYQPSGGMVISSPSRSKALAAAVRAEWSGLTEARHRERLVQDALKPDHIYRRIGAYYRLAYYYPAAVEDVVVKILAVPSFDVFKVNAFARDKLYKAKSPEKRKQLFDAFIRHSPDGQAASDGLLLQLFDDLDTQEAREEGRTNADWVKDEPRRLLIELYGRKPDVRSTDRPYVASMGTGDILQFLKALRHDRSRKVDEAVCGLLNKIKDDDQLAIACMRRLLGRGFDSDIRRYAERRVKRSPHDAEELRRILSSLKRD